MKAFVLFLTLFVTNSVYAAEWLIQTRAGFQVEQILAQKQQVAILQVENLNFNGWYRIVTATDSWLPAESQWLAQQSHVSWVERNRYLHAYDFQQSGPPVASADPVFTQVNQGAPGVDPLLPYQWSLKDTGYLNLPQRSLSRGMENVVAVIDTGIDYNHPELNHAIWVNPKEQPNGIDDDKNGYVDDMIGWDFVDQDNLPYDKTSFFGNPGHGTHCSGVIAALGNNSVGIQGISPKTKIMPLRFLDASGTGTLAGAVKAVKYAVENGAWILSNSWGGSEDEGDDSKILKEVFIYAQTQGRLTVAAAGNSRDNVDKFPQKYIPASYAFDNMLTVAATTRLQMMASYSNYGKTRVHLGAPGSDILSTLSGNGTYGKLDGTSMAAPHVSAAAALYWSQHPQLNFQQVKAAILSSVTPTPALQDVTVTGGRLNIEALMKTTPTGRQ